MKNNDKLLVPAAQKLYSALHSLEQFDKCNDFFDNISHLDKFLSEYRNVTFVIQKSLAHSDLLEEYKALRDKLLKNELSDWFVDKRNEISKEHPFKLEKIVKATIYDRPESIQLNTRIFTADDDADYESLIASLRDFLKLNNPVETYFSIEYIYKEAGTKENLFDKLLPGIIVMKNFLLALNEKVCDKSKQYQDLLAKIDKMNILKVDKTILFVNDFVYYATKDTFISGSQVSMLFPKDRVSLARFYTMFEPKANLKNTLYGSFITCLLKHAAIFVKQDNSIMPVFFTIFDNNTVNIDPFDTTIRSTVYRKIDKISNRIKSNKEKVRAIFLYVRCGDTEILMF